jgi:hypothetical protein
MPPAELCYIAPSSLQHASRQDWRFFWIYEPAPDFYFLKPGKYWNYGADSTFKDMEAERFPYPGTSAARRHGCICPDQLHPCVLDLSNPWLLDVDCPLHGEAAYEEHKKGPRISWKDWA